MNNLTQDINNSLFLLPKFSLLNSFSKVEFFRKSFNSKLYARFISTSYIKFSAIKEQREKSFLFFQDEIWQDEESFRSKYFLKIILSFKKNRDNVILPYFLKDKMDKKTTKKYLKLMSVYLQNSLVENIDQINSKFFIFFYFLTKIPSKLKGDNFEILYKKKLLLRNLFFLFFFSKGRLFYFLTLTKFNSIISKTYVSFKTRRIRYIRTIFPRGLFLLLYSPYRASYVFSSFKQLITKRKSFFLKLKFISKYLLLRKKLNVKKNLNLSMPNCNIFCFKNFSYFSKFSILKVQDNLMLISKASTIGSAKRITNFNLHFKLSKYRLFVPQISESSVCKLSIFSNQKNLSNLYVKKYLKFFLKKLISKIKFFLHYLEFPKLLNIKKKKRKIFRNLSSFFLNYFKTLKSFLKFLNYNFLNFKYSFFRIKSFLFIFNNIVKNLKKNELKNIEKLNFLDFNFISGFFTFKTNKFFKFQKYEISIQKVKQKKLNIIIFGKLRKSTNNFKYFWLFLTTGGVSELYKSFSIFLNSYVSVISRHLNLFLPLKKFSGVLWFLFFSNKINYSGILTIINNYNQLLYYINFLNNKKEFNYFLKAFSLNFHYPILREISYISSNLTENLSNFFDSVISIYKAAYTKNFINKFDYFFAVSEKKLQLIMMDKIQKNPIQKKIVEKRNLANIENLKMQIKRLLSKKRVNLVSKLNEKKIKSNLIKKKKIFPRRLLRKISKTALEISLKKKQQKNFFFWKHVSKRLNFFSKRDGYFNRQGGKRQKRHKKEGRRKVKRFFSNVMFFVKFIKEKKILKSYYKFNKRSFRLSKFHKLSSPFFLRIKLKRIHSSFNGSDNKLIYRTSFLAGSSIGFSLALSTFVSFSFLFLDVKINKNFLEFSNKLYVFYSLTFKYQFSNFIDFLLLKAWLLIIKNNYYMYILKFFNNTISDSFKDYLHLLNFFF